MRERGEKCSRQQDNCYSCEIIYPKSLDIVDIGRFSIYPTKSGSDRKPLASKDIIHSYKDNRVFRERNCGVFFNFTCLIIALFPLGTLSLTKFAAIWLTHNKRVVSCLSECKNFHNSIKLPFEKVTWWENPSEFSGALWFLTRCVHLNTFSHLSGKWIK